ncbi:MAG TPA: polysaccharide biosynthesis/export family protein [Planctomycetota bacterium]|nr:polysaccharide biosynthesis/export family protein [Planctomycetota bacterium]
MFPRWVVLLWLAALVATVSGCANDQQVFNNLIEEKQKPVIKSPDYVVGATDVLLVEVRGQPDLQKAVVIRPDGKVTLRLLGDVYVSGKTPQEIDEDITRLYNEYIVGADVTVSVVGLNSQSIYVMGQVPREGPQPYTGELTILEAISRAGGTNFRAEPKAIQVARDGKVWKVNLDDIVIKAKRGQNMYLQPDDIVFVPLNGFARVGFAMDNMFFPLRSFFSFIFLGDSVSDLKNKHNW